MRIIEIEGGEISDPLAGLNIHELNFAVRN